MFCLLKNLQLVVMSSELNPKEWTHSMQDPIPYRDFYMIKGHDLKGSVCAVPGGEREKLWRDFFSDPSQWWDHRPEKVTEHQSCQSSHVNGRIGLVGVNLVAIMLCSMHWQKFFSGPLHWWNSVSRLEKVSKCNML